MMERTVKKRSWGSAIFLVYVMYCDGKQVYLVGTMHVSPGSVEDVQRAADEIGFIQKKKDIF